MGEPRKDFSSLGAWVKDGLHLPSPLRDFHDQKDVFKSLHEWMYTRGAKGVGEDLPSWIAGQIYVIDWFLRFMALHGWTLQRSRHRVPFVSLASTITVDREREAKAFAAMLDRELDRAPEPSAGVE